MDRDATAEALIQRVGATIDLMQAGDDIDDHCRWVLSQLMQRLGPDDLTPAEALAMCAVLVPVHSRKLALARNPVPPGRVLRLIPPDVTEGRPRTGGDGAANL